MTIKHRRCSKLYISTYTHIHREKELQIDMETIHRKHHVSNKPCVNYMVQALPDRRNVTSPRRCPIHTAGLSKEQLNRRVKFTQKFCTLSQHTKVLYSAINHNDALEIVYMLYYKLTALNSPIYMKIRTKTNHVQTADRWMRHNEAPRSLFKTLWVETMLKNKSVINVHPASGGIYDLLTSQVAYFPHFPQLLAPGS